MASVQYVVDLEAPAYVERVTYIGPGRYVDEATYRLLRFNRPITTFVVSKGQWAKILKGRGKLNVTSKMIQRA
jgi:hypothetical protein